MEDYITVSITNKEWESLTAKEKFDLCKIMGQSPMGVEFETDKEQFEYLQKLVYGPKT